MNKTLIDFEVVSSLSGSELILADHKTLGNNHEVVTIALSSISSFVAARITEGVTVSSLDSTKLPLSGGVLTGPLTATAFYGDGSHLTGITGGGGGTDSSKLPLSGGTLTGGLTGTNAYFNNLSAVTFYGDGSRLTGITGSGGTDSSKLPLSGGTLSGSLTGTTAYFNNLSATTFYGDGSRLSGVSALDSTKLPLSGGTLTGNLTGVNAYFNNLSAVNFYGNGGNLTGIGTSSLRISPDRTTSITQLDNGALLMVVDVGTSSPQPLNLPPTSSTDIQTGFQVMVMQTGLNTIQFIPQGDDLILSEGNRKKTAGRFSIATVVKLTSESWLLYGDLI